MSQVDLLIHTAKVLYLFAFMVRDILWLRILTVIAVACLIPYFYFRPEPLMTPIYWNLVFTALNLYWIVRLLLERRPVKLSEEEQRLCELCVPDHDAARDGQDPQIGILEKRCCRRVFRRARQAHGPAYSHLLR